MKTLTLFVLLTVVAFAGCAAKAVDKPAEVIPDQVKKETASEPVLIELFTSEGCYSCPPAEALLAKYQKEQPFQNVEAITLAFHVDYWDYIGWKDPYASPLFTQRQRVYDRKFRTGRIYTPQMIIDGEHEFVGSNEKKAKKALKKALKKEKVDIMTSIEDGSLKVSAKGINTDEDTTVYLAYAEDDLGSNVTRGENAGKRLNHVAVVRELKGIGRIKPNESSFESTVRLNLQEDWKRDNLKLVVFFQQNSTRRVLGVSTMDLS